MFYNPYSNHYFQVPNPSSPYDGDIPHGLVPGKQVYISGVVLPHADVFKFDLAGPSGIALHVNPRFHAGCVVRNTNRGGWGSEERSGPFPFQKGQPFELLISVEHDKYRVAINGSHAFDYNHRMPYQEVTRLAIGGDLDIHKIVFSGGGHSRGTELINPSIPFATPIVQGAQPGRLIQIQGHTFHHTNRFAINLQNGGQVEPPEIALHFNPRWNDPHTPEPVVVRNTCRYGGWGSEERGHPWFPFVRGQPFDILILLEPHEWKVAVNGQHFVSYAHRTPFNEVNHVSVTGEVQITAVRQF